MQEDGGRMSEDGGLEGIDLCLPDIAGERKVSEQ